MLTFLSEDDKKLLKLMVKATKNIARNWYNTGTSPHSLKGTNGYKLKLTPKLQFKICQIKTKRKLSKKKPSVKRKQWKISYEIKSVLILPYCEFFYLVTIDCKYFSVVFISVVVISLFCALSFFSFLILQVCSLSL